MVPLNNNTWVFVRQPVSTPDKTILKQDRATSQQLLEFARTEASQAGFGALPAAPTRAEAHYIDVSSFGVGPLSKKSCCDSQESCQGLHRDDAAAASIR